MTDVEALLEPISPDHATGADLSYSVEYDTIQEARRSDDATLDQGEWVTELKSADWPAVIEQCTALLKTRTKDLRLAVWMAEACTHLDGFAGLAEGYQLVAGLCDRYWDDLYPLAEDDDQELRIGNLGWMLTQSIAWMRSIPLTDTPGGRYTAIDLELAARANTGTAPEPANHPDLLKIEAARSATPFAFYQSLAEQVPLAQAALQHLQQVIDTRARENGPSFSATRDALDGVAGSALRLASAAGIALPGDAQSPATDVTAGATPAAPARAAGPITTRREALLQLQQVAEFFRRTEPHSPVAYLADRAARWGNMPLHVWLKAVLKDNPALGQLQELLGVESQEPTEGK